MNVYWIRDESPRLGIIPRPRGWDWLEGDIDSIQKVGIDVVVPRSCRVKLMSWD